MNNKETTKKKIIIIGAGPGGLSAGMILAKKGYDVLVLEKDSVLGGRNAPLRIGEYTFEVGPTFVMLPQVFKEIFSLAGKNMEDYLDFRRIDPLYRLRYNDEKQLFVYNDKNKFKEEISSVFPGEENGYSRWYEEHINKFERIYGCLKVPYNKPYHYFRGKLLKAVPSMQIGRTISNVLEDYFKTEEMRMAMGFQAKYLGMSPWQCPGAFSILSYTEHAFGVFHPMGGVHKISEAMAKILEEYGGKIEMNTTVKKVLAENGKAHGVLLSDGRIIEADTVIMNADFAYGMKNLVPEKERPSYSDKKLSSLKYSCSTFMLYLGVDKKYDIPHHNIIFGKDYKKNVEQIFGGKGIPDDPAFYLHNPSLLDPSLAPAGKSAVYVLVPVSNLETSFPWESKKKEIRDMLIRMIEEKTEMKDLSSHIEEEMIFTPEDWRDKVNVYNGAAFNLSHKLSQMLFLRPHNRFEDIKGLYLVGGGTHPGSGLPTILESGRITAEMISGTEK